jgi:RNAse (barnase) inhibitor barstar
MNPDIYIALGLGLWNLLTSGIVGLTMIMLKNAQKKSEFTDAEMMRQNILLNKTREELARDYITKTEVRSDMAQIINRFDRLEEKLDRFIETRK